MTPEERSELAIAIAEESRKMAIEAAHSIDTHEQVCVQKHEAVLKEQKSTNKKIDELTVRIGEALEDRDSKIKELYGRHWNYARAIIGAMGSVIVAYVIFRLTKG